MYLSKSFVFAEGMESGLKKVQNFSEYKFSFDLLGESARTKKQAARYYKDYLNAINLLAKLHHKGLDTTSKPNLSVHKPSSRH